MKTGDAAKRELYFAASFFQFLMKQRSGNMAGYAGNAGFSVAIFRIFCYNNYSKIFGRKECILCQNESLQ